MQQIQTTAFTIAASLGDGLVVTWGAAGSGGDRSAVQDQLKNVQEIQATAVAFAAILGDGLIVTWCNADYGCKGNAVQTQRRMCSRSKPLVVILLPFSATRLWLPGAMLPVVVTAVLWRIKNVQQIQTSFSLLICRCAVAAILD